MLIDPPPIPENKHVRVHDTHPHKEITTHVLLLDLSLVWFHTMISIEMFGMDDAYTHFLLWGKIVHNVKEFADLLGCLAFDHVSHSFATNITVIHQFRLVNKHSQSIKKMKWALTEGTLYQGNLQRG